MKITFIITRADDLGGAQAHVCELATALAGRGEEVTVLAGGKGSLLETLALRGVPCHRLDKLVHPIKLCKDWSAFWEIRSVLSKLKPDLVTTHSNKAGLLGRLAARSLKVPVVHTSHGFLFGGRSKSAAGLFYRLIEKLASTAGNKVIAVSQSEYNLAVGLKVISPEKLALVYNGLPDIEPNLQADVSIEPARLIMVARFSEPKDHDTLLRSLSRLKDHPWTLQLIGEGRDQVAAVKLTEMLGLKDRVLFLGTRSDVKELLADSSLFILSSKREGFPLSILEAMRAGLPVVASGVGGVVEAVEDGKTGYLFPAGDVGSLCGYLEKLINDHALRKQLGKAGRKRYTDHFTLAQMVEKTISVYREVIAECGHPGAL